nr:hypothetical protein Iba_chr06aCG18280 [Ipomoea batatas]
MGEAETLVSLVSLKHWILNGELRAKLWKSHHVVEVLNAALNFPLDPSMEAAPLKPSQLETWLVFDLDTGPSRSMLVLTLYLLDSNPLCLTRSGRYSVSAPLPDIENFSFFPLTTISTTTPKLYTSAFVVKRSYFANSGAMYTLQNRMLSSENILIGYLIVYISEKDWFSRKI